MGWIRLSSSHSHAKSLHKIAVSIEATHVKDQQPKCAYSTAIMPEEDWNANGHPILGCRTIESDLPLIPAEEVMEHNGEDGRRLCTYAPTYLAVCYDLGAFG